VTFFGGSHLNEKRLELLYELAPNASVIDMLLDPNYGPWRSESDVEAAGRAVGR
jgi:hypothetical protein